MNSSKSRRATIKEYILFSLIALLLSNGVIEVVFAADGVRDMHYLKNYNFTEDWFTNYIPLWKRTLANFKGLPNICYLEIGVFEGRSFIWMIENVLTHPTAKLTGIDVFPKDLYQRFMENLNLSGFSGKAAIIKGPSAVELRKLPLESFDIIYIDGAHKAKNVLIDAILSWQLLKNGGIMIFDDYRCNAAGPIEEKPKMALDAFIKIFKDSVIIVSQRYQLIIRKVQD